MHDPFDTSTIAPDPKPPKGLTIQEYAGTLQLTRSWFNWGLILLAIFCVCWIGFLVFWFSMAGQSNSPVLMFVFPIGHVAVGLGLAYVCIAGFVNKTIIRANVQELTIEHGPLWWPGNRVLDPAHIDQLYVKRIRHQSKNGVHYSYHLYARMVDGKHRKLISRLSNPGQARYIEQQLETYLAIVDTDVEGEFSPN